VEVGQARILLDVGAGTLRTLARLERPWSKVTHLFLTHFHTDHVGEVAPLLFALKHGPGEDRSLPLNVLGPRGLEAFMARLADAHGPFVLDPGFPLEIRELAPGTGWRDPGGEFDLSTHPTRHSDGSLAFRIDTLEGTVGYTGDTGPREGLGGFLRGIGLLLAECSNPDAEAMETHLTPTSLARLAREAGPELLVTVHGYPPLEPRDVPGLVEAAGYGGRVLAGEDGLCAIWDSGAIRVDSSRVV
jgi:ribonuclease BN (tRNA processing enzyme)